MNLKINKLIKNKKESKDLEAIIKIMMIIRKNRYRPKCYF
jgi:hypothetical protein